MKHLIYISLAIVFLLSSCGSNEPRFKYQYNLNPSYKWGYAEFYGSYFKNAGLENNVVSLSLFSDSLTVADGGLAGHGQYLFIEDIFIALGDTILPPGRYVAAKTGKPFTFFPGEVLKIDKNEFAVGPFLFYKEKRKAFSVQRFVSHGYFDLSYAANKHVIDCSFTLSDSSKVRGTYNAALPYFDQSVDVPAGAARKSIRIND
jgi:hypothetical protein